MAFEDDIKIDVDQLEVELLSLPELYAKYALKTADAKVRADKLKSKLDLKYAELYTLIKTSPQSYGLDKVTENAVTTTIQQQPDYQKIMAEYLQVKEDLETYRVALSSIEQKKAAVENLIKLVSIEYFSPSGLIDIQQIQQKYEEKRRKIIKQSTKRALNKVKDE